MSNPIAKAERSKAKDQRQIPVPDRVPRHRGKKKRTANPFVVEYRWKMGWLPGRDVWRVFGRYRTEEIAREVLTRQERKLGHVYELRYVGQRKANETR